LQQKYELYKHTYINKYKKEKKERPFLKKVLFQGKESELMVPTFDTLTGEAPEGIGTLTGRQAQ
jgi:hypothetical protein